MKNRSNLKFLWATYIHSVHRVVLPVPRGLRVIRAICGSKIGVDKARFHQPQLKPKGQTCQACYSGWQRLMSSSPGPKNKFAIFKERRVAHRIKIWFSSKIQTNCGLLFNFDNADLHPKIPKKNSLCRFCMTGRQVIPHTKALGYDRERSPEAAAVGLAAVSSFQGLSQACHQSPSDQEHADR
jgi:hypothetical protein